MIAQGRAVSTAYLGQVLDLPNEVDEVVAPVGFGHAEEQRYSPLDHWVQATRQVSHVLRGRSLREEQMRILRKVIVRPPGAPVCVVQPTGAGKTLNVILPAFNAPGVTVLLVPMVPLELDHDRSLKEAGLTVERWSSIKARGGCAPREGTHVLVAPTMAVSDGMFVSMLERLEQDGRLYNITFDEAHLVVTQSTFRPAFRQVGRLARLLSKVRVLAMSATMPKALLSELERMLADGGRAQKIQVVSEVFSKRNVQMIVERAGKTERDLEQRALGWLQTLTEKRRRWLDGGRRGERPERTIVVARTRRLAARLGAALELPVFMTKKETDSYAGGLKDFEAFSRGEECVLVGTSSLTTGLNLSDVRRMLLVGLPYSGLDWVQAAGRCARSADTQGICTTLYSDEEVPSTVEKCTERWERSVLKGGTLPSSMVGDRNISIWVRGAIFQGMSVQSVHT